MTNEQITLRLRGLVVFRALLRDGVTAKLLALLETPLSNTAALAGRYGEFAAALFETTDCWSDYLLNAVLQTENLFARQSTTKAGCTAAVQACAGQELAFFIQLAAFNGEEQRAALGGFMPAWRTCPIDFAAAYGQRLAQLARTGWGMYAKHHVFTVEAGSLVPVRYPDPQRLSELPGYEREREKIVANTRALLAGQAANNALLYGDAGTGKSSTVKALVNEFGAEGLRLVEVKKSQLYQIPDLLEALADNPLKFILFIDDLSFSANDDNFAALKAILEGSVGGRRQNIVVYATSNRRHLIKETFSDREGDDIHRGDTMQELMSLSARFGLTVTFSKPDKDRFGQIVEALARQHGLAVPAERLLLKAEAFALRSGGRSPRVAKQFVEMLCAGVLE